MMRLMLAVLAVALFAGPALAGPGCHSVFTSMGRTLSDVSGGQPDLAARDPLLDCSPGEMSQFAMDPVAIEKAAPIASVDELAGTWVSDDVLGMMAGIYIPVFEVLEITPGERAGDMQITQKLVRAVDAAEWFMHDYGVIPAVDVIAAGRIATYGQHRAVLARPGEIEPRRVRYFDFPIEGDRSTALAMKIRYLGMTQTVPIKARRHENVLVLTFFDRLAGGERTMTFRRRASRTPERAMLIAMLGEISMTHFPCLLEAIEAPSPALAAALGDYSREQFFAALDEADALHAERDALLKRMQANRERGSDKADAERLNMLADRVRRLHEETAFSVLVKELSTGKPPFGCPQLF